jgi:hypothetical protein
MGEPQAADEGGEAPCYAHLVDPQSGEIAEGAAGGRRGEDRDRRRDLRHDGGCDQAGEGVPPAGRS